MTNKEQELLDEVVRSIYERGYADGNKKGYNNRKIEEEFEEKPNDYEQGLNDAWEAARKIACIEGYNWTELENMFNTKSLSTIFNTYTASEAIAKIKEYDEIKVGDEVKNIDTFNKCVVTRISPYTQKLDFIKKDGSTGLAVPITKFKKTGQHFPQIEEMLKQMEEGE